MTLGQAIYDILKELAPEKSEADLWRTVCGILVAFADHMGVRDA